jgi:hypothetical protein
MPSWYVSSGFVKWGLMSATLLALAGCHHGSKLYSTEDARRAFAKEGFVLVPTGIEHRLLLPKSGEPFTVVVARSEADAKSAYRALNRQSTRLTFDLRVRNVLTTSDTGLSLRDKARLRRAMRHLR